MKQHTYKGLRATLMVALTLLPVADLLAQGDYIRQRQLDITGVTWDYYVPTDEGAEPASLPISLQGAEFSLYAKGIGNDDKTYFLDSKVVGAFQPAAEVTIISEDPNVPLRTRADRPFKVKLQASGMVNDDTAPQHQNSVYFRRVYEEYDRETHAPPTNTDSQQIEVESFYMKNGALQRTQLTAIPPGADNDPTKVEGEEVFTIFSSPDEQVPAYGVLDSEVIQIWPVAVGEIIGLADGDRVLRSVPLIRQKVEDLYPDSLTYIQIYPGEQVDGTEGTPINASLYPVPSTASVPQDCDVPVESWDDYCPEDGIYTIELLTITPFNDGAPEILDTVTFEVDRTIKVRAHVGGSQ